jgi:uncharacterized membrane protein YvlD (DUF360 family)
MKEKIYTVVINLMLFWIVTDLFEGIKVQEGVLGYIVCGGIFGLCMLAVVPLVRFFTLPVKFITLFLISMMISVIVFFVLYVGIPFIDFLDGALVGFSNRYFDLPELELSTMGNVFVGGAVAGILSSVLQWLSNQRD